MSVALHWSFDSDDPSAHTKMRMRVIDYLASERKVDGDFGACNIIVGELLANAARHGVGGPIDIEVDWAFGRPVLSVTNRGSDFAPAPRLPGPESESGRGLFIISSLAAEPPLVSRRDARSCTVTVGLPLVQNV